MSFFGRDARLPRDRGHPVTAPGFGQAPDPFITLSQDRHLDEDEDDGYALDLRIATKLTNPNALTQH